MGRAVKRSTLICLLVLSVHLGIITSAVSLSQEPQAKSIDKTIEGIIIPAPVAEQAAKPIAKPILPEPIKQHTAAQPQKKQAPKPEQPKQQQSAPQKKVAKPNFMPAKTENSPNVVSESSPASKPPTSNRAETAKTAPVETTSVSQPVASANSAVNKVPIYPMLSRRLKEQGTVYLQVLVLKSGKVGQLQIKQSSGFSRLDKAAINAVRHWQYQPAQRQGKAIDYWFTQPITFNLNSTK